MSFADDTAEATKIVDQLIGSHRDRISVLDYVALLLAQRLRQLAMLRALSVKN
jgi:hypothetical protein